MSNKSSYSFVLRWAMPALLLSVSGSCGSVGNPSHDASATACAASTCENSILVVCASGMVERVEECLLGCQSTDRCKRLLPSNGLGPQLDTAAAQEAITLPSGTTINTDTGEVRSSTGVIAVATAPIVQQDGPSLRVFLARTWTIHDVRVDGSLPIAFVSVGDLEVVGTIDVSADGRTPGPGAINCGANGTGGNPYGGYWSHSRAGHPGAGAYIWNMDGAGGGGFGTAGGIGGNDPVGTPGVGGIANGSLVLAPLRGGCSGGGIGNPATGSGYGGGGGGAIQLVSGTGEIRITATAPSLACIHVGGGGGRGSDNGGVLNSDQSGTGGGGSGGGILIEAARVVFEGSAQLLAAGGGGGGSGGCGELRHGQDAPPSEATAAGGMCPVEAWGQPASGGAGAAAAAAAPGVGVDYHAAGSGGGGHGRIRINTATGAYTGDALIRGASSIGTVQAQ